MRDILFCGKRIDNGEWIEGSLLQVTANGAHYSLIFGDDFQNIDGEMKSMTHAVVAAETVGQFTGQYDRNALRIFEGNICRFYNDDGETTDYAVVWFQELARWGVKQVGLCDVYIDDLDLFFCRRCEVVANAVFESRT